MRLSRFCIYMFVMMNFCGCASVHGNTWADKREFVQSMRQIAIEELYRLRPQAEYEVNNAKGFAVFSNINSHLFLLSTGSGYGIAKNALTGEETYMKMFSLGGGLGLGAKDYRAIIIFNKEDDFNRFAKGGWDFSGTVDAAAKSSDKGGSLTGARSLGSDIIVYQLTEAGLIIHVTLQGTKYWQYHELN